MHVAVLDPMTGCGFLARPPRAYDVMVKNDQRRVLGGGVVALASRSSALDTDYGKAVEALARDGWETIDDEDEIDPELIHIIGPSIVGEPTANELVDSVYRLNVALGSSCWWRRNEEPAG